MLFFCLPAGLLVLAVWKAIAMDPVRHLLGFSDDPAPSESGLGFAWWLRASIAILLGAATHLLWDGVTHGGYWDAELFPGLREPVPLLRVPWFNFLQHASTIIGGLIVVT